jgi:hypothetical protein
VNIVLFLAQQKLLALLDGMYRKFLENVSRLLFRHLFISLEKYCFPSSFFIYNFFYQLFTYHEFLKLIHRHLYLSMGRSTIHVILHGFLDFSNDINKCLNSNLLTFSKNFLYIPSNKASNRWIVSPVHLTLYPFFFVQI